MIASRLQLCILEFYFPDHDLDQAGGAFKSNMVCVVFYRFVYARLGQVSR